jgi:hypothetical protein
MTKTQLMIFFRMFSAFITRNYKMDTLFFSQKAGFSRLLLINASIIPGSGTDTPALRIWDL